MIENIKIQKTKDSRLKDLDFNNIPLGRSFTDHMFICDYMDGTWVNPRIVPLDLIPTHPAAMALHYGQAIFEGMKATMDDEGIPMLFRPDKNAERLNVSADRMGMPRFPESLFIEALKQFVLVEKDWIPPAEGSALYLRPFMYADEPFIGMRAATTYRFMVIASPSGPMFSRRIKLYAETKYIRAADGGTGEAKAAGNYAAAIRPTELAKEKGYDQVLWLDAQEFKYIQEVGTMNIFFKIDGKIYTPSLDGSILSGITRMSVIELLKADGYEVIERPISINEILMAQKSGTLEEAFGTGTAVGVAIISEIGYKDQQLVFADENPVGLKILNDLNAIRNGSLEDRFNWMVKIQNELA
ncbi:MAG: branched-chain amino acid aminotransferase [Flavobacteriaceae bacterium]|nr:branched-chain amino acid aminotransferase [Bacteroidia bacterium]MBT8287215.1 branched-chain amino acid aminotransferase [Bacteroidia bacterium]NNF75573.1 branched-chain amino acid aminotransferase [Flavobacteriaceae bacterium]NNK73602.1 branched-chain amino acid aminotransferase [Flavobacteriaceae bacterium]